MLSRACVLARAADLNSMASRLIINSPDLEAPQLEVTIELEGSAPTTPPRAPSPPAGPPSPLSGPPTLDKNVGRGDVEEYPILLD